MNQPTEKTTLTLWQIIEWGHELDEIAAMIDSLAAQIKNIQLDHEEDTGDEDETRPLQVSYPCLSNRRHFHKRGDE